MHGAWVGGAGPRGGVGFGQKEIGTAANPARARIRPTSWGPGMWRALEGCMGVIVFYEKKSKFARSPLVTLAFQAPTQLPVSKIIITSSSWIEIEAGFGESYLKFSPSSFLLSSLKHFYIHCIILFK